MMRAEVAQPSPGGWGRPLAAGEESQADAAMRQEAALAAIKGHFRRTWGEPIPLDSYSPARLDLAGLPTWVKEFVEAQAEYLQVAPELVLAGVLGALSAALGGKVMVEVKPGYQEPVNLYLIAPAPPAERKTAVLSACLAPLYGWERERAQAMKAEIADTASRRRSQEAVISGLRGRLARVKPEERPGLIAEIADLERALPELPRAPRLVADDTTSEALARLMADHGGRMAVASCEGGLFDTLAGRYSSGVPNLDLVLKAHAGEPVRVDRRNASPVTLDAPALTLCILPQPEVLAGLAAKPGFRGRGLLARFIYLLPQSRLGHRSANPPPVAEAVSRAYERAVRALLDLPLLAQDQHGQPTAHTVRLDDQARREWLAFSQALEPELAGGGRLETISDWAGKLPGLAARLAGLLHFAVHLDQGPGRPINPENMTAALTLASGLVDHALAAFGLMGADPELEAAQHALGWIREERLDRFSVRDCHRALRGRYPKAEKVRSALRVLEERGFIRPQEQARHGPGRAPSPVYEVNPLLREVAP